MAINNFVSLHWYLPFDPSAVLNKLPGISTEISSEESGDVIAANTVESMLYRKLPNIFL